MGLQEAVQVGALDIDFPAELGEGNPSFVPVLLELFAKSGLWRSAPILLLGNLGRECNSGRSKRHFISIFIWNCRCLERHSFIILESCVSILCLQPYTKQSVSDRIGISFFSNNSFVV